MARLRHNPAAEIGEGDATDFVVDVGKGDLVVGFGDADPFAD